MTQATPHTTVRKTITVAAPLHLAYRVFTERFAVKTLSEQFAGEARLLEASAKGRRAPAG